MVNGTEAKRRIGCYVTGGATITHGIEEYGGGRDNV